MVKRAVRTERRNTTVIEDMPYSEKSLTNMPRVPQRQPEAIMQSTDIFLFMAKHSFGFFTEKLYHLSDMISTVIRETFLLEFTKN